MLSVNALMGINSDLAHALVFRSAGLSVITPPPPPHTRWDLAVALPILLGSMLSTTHAGYMHAQPMPASVDTHRMPSPRQLCVHCMLRWLHQKPRPPVP